MLCRSVVYDGAQDGIYALEVGGRGSTIVMSRLTTLL